MKDDDTEEDLCDLFLGDSGQAAAAMDEAGSGGDGGDRRRRAARRESTSRGYAPQA